MEINAMAFHLPDGNNQCTTWPCNSIIISVVRFNFASSQLTPTKSWNTRLTSILNGRHLVFLGEKYWEPIDTRIHYLLVKAYLANTRLHLTIIPVAESTFNWTLILFFFCFFCDEKTRQFDEFEYRSCKLIVNNLLETCTRGRMARVTLDYITRIIAITRIWKKKIPILEH